ncbi:MAG: HAD family hydrolase [Patescibacteria group bacterium]
MIKAIVSDFSRVVLLPNDETYTGGLNALHKKLSKDGEYDFWNYFRLNSDLVDFYKSISSKVDVYIFTKGYIQEYPVLKEKIRGSFKNIFSASELGIKKDNDESYRIIADLIKIEPEQVIYIDDNQDNLNSAKKAGMHVICYNSNEQVINSISEELKLNINKN